MSYTLWIISENPMRFSPKTIYLTMSDINTTLSGSLPIVFAMFIFFPFLNVDIMSTTVKAEGLFRLRKDSYKKEGPGCEVCPDPSRLLYEKVL